MNNWTWNESLNRRRANPARGHGSFTPTAEEPSTDFKLDEKSGLFLPETVNKERRKVRFGFQKEADAS